MTTTNALWVEKYRPRSIEDYIFYNDRHEQQVQQMIRDKSIPHLILAGVQGTGKTTLAQLLISAMELDPTDVLTLNASDDRGIEVFRNTIKNFATSCAVGRFKIIYLEEAERLTPVAQDAMKRFMEEVSDYVRFILTTNNINNIIAPIRSRCQDFQFKPADVDDVTEYAVTVLSSENVKFTLDDVDKYIAVGYPDIRKIINTMQSNTVNGVLQSPEEGASSSDYKFKLLKFLERGDWTGARELLCANVSSDEWESVYRFLYENLHHSDSFKKKELWDEAIIIIAEHLYKNSICADPEINMAACLIRISMIK